VLQTDPEAALFSALNHALAKCDQDRKEQENPKVPADESDRHTKQEPERQQTGD
jgi:hypothetical protein